MRELSRTLIVTGQLEASTSSAATHVEAIPREMRPTKTRLARAPARSMALEGGAQTGPVTIPLRYSVVLATTSKAIQPVHVGRIRMVSTGPLSLGRRAPPSREARRTAEAWPVRLGGAGAWKIGRAGSEPSSPNGLRKAR